MAGEETAKALEEAKEFQVEARAVTRTKDKVCIVGCADSKKLVPFDDDSFEFWGVNNLYGVNLPGAHWDRWFEIHNIEIGPDGKYRRRESLDFRGQNVKDYLEGIGKMDCPVVYMQKKWDIIPQSIEYPLDAICAVFGRYLTNTISYELALAILMGFKEIHVYGVDMAVGSEYEFQRPSCEYFLGLAVGKGITIFIPDEADLLKARFLYGFEERKRAAWESKVKQIDKDMAKKQAAAEAQIEQLKTAVNQYIGARFAVGELNKIWGNLDDE